MDSEYDRKFEEMKKYIPFLESMIKRLESTSSASANPRQAQLDKIRSLRDLLLDKKKRMKMENLLKCEQVLVNLYAKVEQRDTLTGVMKVKEDSVFAIESPTPKEKSDLEAVRNKLKSVAKIQDNIEDKEFEIARASEIEEVCTSGSKEPALFQRRPNISSKSPSRFSPSNRTEDAPKSQVPNAKRNYTRVLVSPEPSSRRWSSADSSEEKPLFSRRSPRRSPRRHSPTYHKKEKKKSSKDSHSKKSKGINITLNVPEESLNSLNTIDILPRIMNCRDGDVDIDTLRELRKQILGELKKTGANDDISDLILKSYNKKHKFKKKEEVEEGELSDSESEAIENIYGSLVVKDQNNPGIIKNSEDKDNRKIQICLVINSDKDQPNSTSNKICNPNQDVDATDFEMYNEEEAKEKVKKSEIITILDESDTISPHKQTTLEQSGPTKINISDKQKEKTNVEIKNLGNAKVNVGEEKSSAKWETNTQAPNNKVIETSTDSVQLNTTIDLKKDIIKHPESTPKLTDTSCTGVQELLAKPVDLSEESVSFKPNFYKPLVDPDNTDAVDKIKDPSTTDIAQIKPIETSNNDISVLPVNTTTISDNSNKIDSAVEIPLLHEPTVAKKPDKSTVSEIDILQALKNEILSEPIALSSEENSTPLLHQPKLNKVANAKEILPKKRISIEKYKEKSSKPRPARTYLFTNESNMSKEDQMKKSKIKLTEKECERFNIPKISFDEDSSDLDDLDKDEDSLADIYGDLAPKSPDHDETSNIESTPPVIIPADPIKTVAINHKADVDMRTQVTCSSENIQSPFHKINVPLSNDGFLDGTKNNRNEHNTSLNDYRPPLVDPRIRRDQQFNKESPVHTMNPERTPRSTSVSINLNIGPSMTPNRTPIMTPNARSYEMTPNHQPFDVDQGNRKHVYAPSFSASETHEVDTSMPRLTPHWEHAETKNKRRSRFEDVRDLDPRSNSVQREVSQNVRYSRFDKRDERPVSRADCPLTPLPSFGRSDPSNLAPVKHYVPFARTDSPLTPSHPFGRTDCPATPSHPFGRSECPVTPNHPFGRSDCPSTPIHPFGRSDATTTSSHGFNRMECPSMPSFAATDCPPTPGNAFGRTELPVTSTNPFGISDCPRTPSHPFGKSEFNPKFNKDPRLHRKSEYESNSQCDENERDYYKDRGYRGGSSYKTQKPYCGSDSYRNYEREQSVTSGDKYKFYGDKSGRTFNRDQMRQDYGRSMTRDYDNDRYNREKGSRFEKGDTGYEEVGTRRYQRERSVGRVVQPENNYNSSSRAPSVGRNVIKESENKFSVKPDTGRSFTIDTSVNTTFQKLLESGKGIQVFDYSFDSRRQRAASVGRILTREPSIGRSYTRESSVGRSFVRDSSVGRTLSQGFKSNKEPFEKKRDSFRRASSVGRDLAVSKKAKSFQEIKAEFESYRNVINKIEETNNKKLHWKTKTNTEKNDHYRKKNNKQEKYPQTSSNASYSPRKNYRDPRMRKNDIKDTRTTQNNRDPKRRNSGIDYSSDNIAKGTVLGTGTGVRNYKIPKIKRPVEEKIESIEKELEKLDKIEPKIGTKKECVKSKEQDTGKKQVKGKEKEKVVEKRSETVKDKAKENVADKSLKQTNEVAKEGRKSLPAETKISKYKTQIVTEKNDKDSEGDDIINDFNSVSNDSITSKSEDYSERRITRSTAKGFTELKSPDSSPIKKRSRKYKKKVFHDSESDSEMDLQTTKNITTPKAEKKFSPVKMKKSNETDLDSSFGIDELEMFADNPGSDSVIDNINALIADLDNDIDTSKTDAHEDFTKDITLDNIFQSLTSHEHETSDVAVNKEAKVSQNTNTNRKIQDDKAQKLCLLPEGEANKNVTSDNDIANNDESTSPSITEKKPCEDLQSEDSKNKNVKESENTFTNLEPIKNLNDKSQPETNKSLVPCKSINEDIVSTTHKEISSSENVSLKEQDIDGISTPDSTIDTDNCIVENSDKAISVPDSTNEVHSEANVTSTETESKNIDEPSSSKPATAIDSIGNLLSLLQDKSKILEVLNMLGNQSNENEKIKKKLEKLSEIMSEEEDETLGKNEIEQTEVIKDESAISNTDNSLLQNVNNSSSVANIEESSSVAKTDDSSSSVAKIDDSSLSVAKIDNSSLSVAKMDDSSSSVANVEEFSSVGNIDKSSSVANVEESVSVAKINVSSSAAHNDELSSVAKINETPVLNSDGKSTILQESVAKCPAEDEEPIKSLGDNKHNQENKESNESTTTKKHSFENIENEDSDPEGDAPLEEIRKTKKKRKTKFTKKNKGKQNSKRVPDEPKRVTRATVTAAPKIKKPSRELLKLQEDIKEMFIRDDVLLSSGIRMCRLAKLVDEKNTPKDNVNESEPVVVLEKFKNLSEKVEEQEKIVRKKPGPKPKVKIDDSVTSETSKSEANVPLSKYKAGPKSKTKLKKNERDPYAFETDSVDTNTEKPSDDDSDSDSESDSLISSQSFGSSESLSETKKKSKRKRSGWQAGVIKPKNKKKKVELKVPEVPPNIIEEKDVKIPDINCFTDRSYCFRKNVTTYSCRLCLYSGDDIVNHYKKQHPHTEIPLSRVAPLPAKAAISQCKDINFQAICKVPSDHYICIFCFKKFTKRGKDLVLETFFWHIVSTHTGEYKHTCTECVNVDKCPFNLDIPSPPKDIKGQLIGYICKKCNFTQISLENLKTHVIVRHNDEQTAVHTINLSSMSKNALAGLIRQSSVQEPLRLLRSGRSNQSLTEASDDYSDVAETSGRLSDTESVEQPTTEADSLPVTPKECPIQSKITFETDDNTSETLDTNDKEEDTLSIKTEHTEAENAEETSENEGTEDTCTNKPSDLTTEEQPRHPSDDIVDYAHFKISFTETGAKEYICCINRQEKHFKTTLLISMKKHVQTKHSENWDGYCYMCKVIVTPQGAHHFKDCFQHYLDKHIDDFPVMEKEVVAPEPIATPPAPEYTKSANEPIDSPTPIKPYINVRPLCDLISTEQTTKFPKIESVVSLGPVPTVLPPEPSPTYPVIRTEPQPQEKQYKYEEAQAVVMSNKHRVVLDTMMSRNKLIKVFKCAGRFCSFATDSAEDALLHASTHQRIGGIDALSCSYCDFDANGNAIDLVMHVFKSHGSCQYSCGQCFYRAAASQLVGAHMTRVHASRMHDAVLRTTTATAPPSQVNMLSREEAVQYYVCGHSEDGGKCKFRTYIPDKFSEHLQQRHGKASWHPCHICSLETATPHELVVHMMSHGLKLYQCTWCVHGVDKESELLAHVSAVHPSKQPQAYLRIITNKDGTNELRVLPLAFLNKTKILTEDVVPSGAREDPIREAERSIELEKLIGHANLIIQASQAVDSTPVEEPIASSNLPAQNQDDDLPSSPIHIATPVLEPGNDAEPIAAERRAGQSAIAPMILPHVTPPRSATPLDISLQTTPVLKVEPVDTPTKQDEIVVLDSDDEDSAPPVPLAAPTAIAPQATPAPSAASVVNPSETQQSETDRYKKVSLRNLHKCPKCKIVCKAAAGFKKHLSTCLAPHVNPKLKCPHCLLIFTKDDLLTHYATDHREECSVECGECGIKYPHLSTIKRHMKMAHNANDIDVKKLDTHLLASARKPKVYPKRKLSATTAEPSPSKRRYHPQDVDQLPINPILDQLVYCSICEFSTKVRLNMVRHLQLHAEQQPVAQTAPVNPVPHLETNEKHFDRMVNLASSSLVSRAPDKPRPDSEPSVTVLIPPEAASRYPKYVPERQRLTCGAKGCSYISVDENMMKYHWETLHSGTSEYHCVHCPPYQHLDTSKPLTAARVLAHLKMHDVALYACSSCSYYHSKREALEKHLTDVHKGGKLMVVREEASAVAVPTPSQASAAPTMDLKPWQCGLCKFKSMLRPEVIEHCGKVHQSKMQFKCGYCPFRTSAMENITKHQSNSHQGREENVFYYYYREDSVPGEADGTPRWMKQRQKMGLTETEIKMEAHVSPPSSPAVNPVTEVSAPVTPSLSTDSNASSAPLSVDLSLVKKEAVDESSPGSVLSIEMLYKKYGALSEPNGLHYTCPLCNVVADDSMEAMQCHLYEELKYRKWGCGLCPYKAYHKTGLNEHMSSEHPRQYNLPIELPIDHNMEKWVTAQLQHQKSLIDKNRLNLTKLKQSVARRPPGPSNLRIPPPECTSGAKKYSVQDLEEAFGPFGSPNEMKFSCPKCKFATKDEAAIKDHFESELSKIRWCCSKCTATFQTYHEAQFHVKSHAGEAARPKEAIRDSAMRSAWVTNAIQAQKQILKPVSSEIASETLAPENENSLLVVRYAEKVTTPETAMPVRRKRPAPDSDEDRYDPAPEKPDLSCQYCDFKTKYATALKRHLPKHFNLKPFMCGYCDFNSYRQAVVNHSERAHPGQPIRVKVTDIPPDLLASTPKKRTEDDVPKMICLHCEKFVPETETNLHSHDNVSPEFGRKGDVVVKCCICLVLRIDVKSLQEHHNVSHPDIPINYALFKLHYDTRETHSCGHCQKGFKYIRDLKTHHNAVHGSLQLMYTSASYSRQGNDDDRPNTATASKRCARKSTTKLPNFKTVARKSTTKLPHNVNDEFSYYNSKRASLQDYAHVTTFMPFCNTMMPFTVKKLSEIIKIEPKVLVKDIISDTVVHKTSGDRP